ncbi:MAG: DUF3307 domain-containing protein [Coriobacteriia bacterium]
MGLFLDLYLGHLLGDFVFQPGKLVAAKRAGVPGLLTHAVIIAVCSAVVLVGTLRAHWPIVVLVTGAHLVIERLTITTRFRTRTRGLFVFVFDQTLHVLSIVLLIWAMGAWTLDRTAVTFGSIVGIADLAAACGIITVAFLGSILVFETDVAIEDPENGKGRLLAFDLPRIAGMAERATALVLALYVSPTAGLIAFLPRSFMAITRRDDRRRDIVAVVVGLALCAVAYAFVVGIRIVSLA